MRGTYRGPGGPAEAAGDPGGGDRPPDPAAAGCGAPAHPPVADGGAGGQSGPGQPGLPSRGAEEKII